MVRTSSLTEWRRSSWRGLCASADVQIHFSALICFRYLAISGNTYQQLQLQPQLIWKGTGSKVAMQLFATEAYAHRMACIMHVCHGMAHKVHCGQIQRWSKMESCNRYA